MERYGTIYVKEFPNSTGKKVANRIIKYLELFVSHSRASQNLDDLLGVTYDDELKIINKDFEVYEETIKKKNPDPEFDYRKYCVLKNKNTYVEPEFYGSMYPNRIVISKNDYKKLVAYNPNIVENNRILDMKLCIVKEVIDRRENEQSRI